MNTPNKKDRQVVQTFASMNVPEHIWRESNLEELLHDITAEQDTVKSDSKRLERLRKEKADAGFIKNFWNDQNGKVQDAQLDLNQSVSRLTQKSSQLLIVNTAISKVLNDQQHILLEQQQTLKRQTGMLEEQNYKILAQQKQLEHQQQEINKANQGLMEAKGLTQEQARELVGCVKKVNEAETRIAETNQALKSDVTQSLNEAIEQCVDYLQTGFTEHEQRYAEFKQEFTRNFSDQSQHTQAELKRFTSETEKFKTSIDKQLQTHIQTIQKKNI